MAPWEIQDEFDDSALWGALDNIPAPPQVPYQQQHTTGPHVPDGAQQTHQTRHLPIDHSNYHNVKTAAILPPLRRVRVELFLSASGHKLVVCPPPGWYDNGFVSLCRSVPGASFCGTKRRWTFPDGSLQSAIRIFKTSKHLIVELALPSPIAMRALQAVAGIEKGLAREASGGCDGSGVDRYPNPKPNHVSSTQCSDLTDIDQSVPLSGREKDKENPGALGGLLGDVLPRMGKQSNKSPGTAVHYDAGTAVHHGDVPTSTLAKQTVDKLYDSIPESIRTAMFPFQREGVRFALERGGRCLIGDQMGLGKTVQAIACASVYKQEWPCLILVPTSLRGAWEQALVKWLGDEVMGNELFGNGKGKSPNSNAILSIGSGAEGKKLLTYGSGLKFCIVPYSLVTKIQQTLIQKRFQVVICDESHFLKDGKAQRTKAVVPLLKNAKRALCLTGTPALSRPVEIFSQAEALRPAVFTKFNEFAQRYCAGSRFGWQGSTNAEELHAVLSRLVMIRRLKKDVLTQLPAKQREKILIALQGGEAVGKVKAIRERMEQLRMDGDGNKTMGNNSMEEKRVMNELYQASAFAKAKPVAEYMETLLDSSGSEGDGSDTKFLFFGHHTCMLDGVSEMFKKRKISFIRIDGSTPTDTRQNLVDRFQTDQKTRVAVLSIKAAGMGLTLTAASCVVFGELSWTPGDIVQAEDRAHRIGQKNCVNVQFLCAKNTVDDMMWGSISNKLETLGQVLDGQKGDSLELKDSKGRKAYDRTREHRLETLVAFGDRSPGGRLVDRPGGFGDGASGVGVTPKKQATLDLFVAKKPKETPPAAPQPAQSQQLAGAPKWCPPADWDDFDDTALLGALEANPSKRHRHA